MYTCNMRNMSCMKSSIIRNNEMILRKIHAQCVVILFHLNNLYLNTPVPKQWIYTSVVAEQV